MPQQILENERPCCNKGVWYSQQRKEYTHQQCSNQHKLCIASLPDDVSLLPHRILYSTLIIKRSDGKVSKTADTDSQYSHVRQPSHPNSLTPPQLANICLLIFPVGSRTHAEGSIPLHALDGCLMAQQSPIIAHA